MIENIISILRAIGHKLVRVWLIIAHIGNYPFKQVLMDTNYLLPRFISLAMKVSLFLFCRGLLYKSTTNLFVTSIFTISFSY